MPARRKYPPPPGYPDMDYRHRFALGAVMAAHEQGKPFDGYRHGSMLYLRKAGLVKHGPWLTPTRGTHVPTEKGIKLWQTVLRFG